MVLSGKYKTGEQILRLTNERFAVPEILFHPSDIGIQEMGIPEAIVHSIQNLPEGITQKSFENLGGRATVVLLCVGFFCCFWFCLFRVWFGLFGFVVIFFLSIQSILRSWYFQYPS